MISAVILTKNNQDTIQKTIKSLSWCDEVIVVDDKSTDETLKHAKKEHVTVYSFALDNNFSRMRNFGLKKAKGEWVFFVDSDEIVTKVLAEEIQNVLRSTEDNGIKGYYIKRIDYFLGKWLRHGETANTKILRLAKKNNGVWEGAVHEVWNIKGKTDTLKSSLKHYPHSNVAQFINDIHWYTTIRAKELYDKNVRCSVIHIILFPSGKFFQNYIFRLGFLDNVQGLIMACLMSFHSFLVRAKLWHLQHSRPK